MPKKLCTAKTALQQVLVVILQKAAELAREMVINQGMGKKLRNQVFHVEDGMMMDRLVHERQFSDETAKVIDDEVESLITEAANLAHVK